MSLPELDQLAGIDTTTPSIARVYDAVLGGKDNYAVDRAVRDQLQAIRPEGLQLARDNRAWLIRVVRYLSSIGIDQFVDCGSGLPTAENTHQVAQRLNPDARILYIDNDPIVLTHGRALLAANDNSRFLAADVADPATILEAEHVRKFIDFSRPVGLLHVGILHHVIGPTAPYEVMDRYLSALAPGSHVAISHFFNPRDGSELAHVAEQTEAVLLGGDLGSGEFRTREDIGRLFRDWPLLEPGLTYLPLWWPDGPPPAQLPVYSQLMLCGVAKSPS